MAEKLRHNVAVVGEIIATLGMEDMIASVTDERAMREIREAIAPLVEPDFEVTMEGPDYLPGNVSEHGVRGLGRAWEDWLTPYESFRIEVGEVIEAGERVVTLVRLRGRTKTGGVDVENDAAAVWHLRNGRLSKVEFHLDIERAMKAAGLDR